ncbi:MAG: tetratricopeptide repeat protein [Planctomycetes bacterium]|nr:tetratricopeptide repeat protein [Planctomycetota bacterium]
MNKRFGSRFDVVRVLGQGGMGRVLLVRDTAKANGESDLVALKTIARGTLESTRVDRLKEEFRLLSTLRHPHLCRVHEFGYAEPERLHYFTSEFVDGVDLLRACDGRPFREVARLIAQVLRALEYLHSRRIVHRDVKPQNVLVRSHGKPDATAVLVDFGLSAEVADSPAGTSGTPRYMAPEARSGSSVDPRSDVYSIGVMLHEIVFGDVPRVDDDARAIETRIEKEPRRGLPLGLAGFLSKCVDPVADRRFDSAREALVELTQIAELKTELETEETKEGYILSAGMVGREEQLRTLLDAFQSLDAGAEGSPARVQDPHVVLVTGEAGAGKSRLLDEFRVLVQLRGGWFVRASAGDGSGLGEVAALRLVRDVAAVVGEQAPALPSDANDGVDERIALSMPSAPSSRVSLYESWTRFLFDVPRNRSLVVFLDDLHSADATTLEFASYFARNLAMSARPDAKAPHRVRTSNEPSPASSTNQNARVVPPILFVVAARNDTTSHATSAFTAKLIRDAKPIELELPPLSRTDVARLLAAMLRQTEVPEPFRDRLYALTSGNPLFLTEVMRRLVSEISMPVTGRHLDTDLSALWSIEIPDSLDSVLAARLDRLSAVDRKTAATIALLSRPESAEFLARCIGAETLRIEQRLQSLTRQGILVTIPAPGDSGRTSYRFGNELLRAAITKDLSETERKQVHRRIASAYRCDADSADALPDSVFAAVAHHLVRATPGDEAYSLAVEAARRAKTIFAHEAAAAFLRDALSLIESGHVSLSKDDGERALCKIHRELGDLWKLLGHSERAFAEYEASGAHAIDPGLAAEVRLRRARLYLDTGAVKQACAEAIAAIRGLPKVDHVRRASAMAILGRLAVVRGSHDRARHWAVLGLAEVGEDVGDDEALVRRELRRVAADALSAKGNYREAIALLEQNIAEEEAAGDIAGAASSENVIGNNWLRVGDYGTAEDCYRRSLDRREAIGDVAGIAACQNNLGIIAGYRNDYVGAIECYKRAALLAEKAGDPPSVANAFNNLANAYFSLAKWDRATECYRKSLVILDQLHDLNGRARILNNLAGVLARRCLYSDAIEHYQQSLEVRQRLGSRSRVAATLNNLASVLLSIGDVAEAEAVLAKAASHARDEGLQYESADNERHRGRASLIRGAASEAVERFRTARDEFRRLGNRVEEADAGLWMVEALLAQGTVDGAREILRESVQVIPTGAAPDLGVRADFLRFRLATDESQPVDGDRIDALRQILTRITRTNDQRLLLSARFLMGRLLRARGEHEAAFSCFIKVLEVLETLWTGLSDLRHKETLLNSSEIRDFFRAIQGLETDVRSSLSRRIGVLPGKESTPEHQTDLRRGREEGWTRGLFVEAKSNLYEIGRALDLSKERFDKNTAGLKRILEISQVMNSTFGLNKLFKLIVDRVIEITQAERGFVILVDESGTALDIKVAYDLSKGEEMRNVHSEVSHTIITHVIREKRPLLYHDAMNEGGLDEKHSVVKLDLRSIMCVPLMHRARLLGVIYVDNRTTIGQFTEADLELLNIFANQAALALENSRLFENLQNSLKNLKDTQDQLVRSERLRALGEMAGGVAHDFNNLLSSILGRAQLLQREVHDDRVRRELGVIEKAALDGAGTIKRIQNFTRVRKDKDFTPVSMNSLVDDVLEFCRTRLRDEADAKGHAVEVVKDLGKIPDVDGNPPELREVLTNVFFNALDAMPNGGKLVITTRDEGDVVALSVTDTGVGMSDETKRRIFDPFYSTKGNRGTGLGMSIVYGIVQRHRGDIHVESELGRGSTVTVRVPISSGITPSDRTLVNPQQLQDSAASILVIDDEQGICRLLTDILTRAGYKVSACTSGRDAMQVFQKNNFDIVLTDLGMPEMTGWEVAREIRRSDPTIPIALITGWAVELDDQKVKQNGVDLVITKPFNVEDVLNLIVEGIEFGKKKRESPPVATP